MALDGMIFDVDGTLVDSNGAHVRAWMRALEQFDYRVARDRIFEEVGKGGDNLVPALLGKEADEKDGDALRKAEPKEFARIAMSEGLKPYPGAVELLEQLRRRSLRTALGTSGQMANLKTIEKASGVEWSKLADETVTGDDASRSKPAPDLVSAAAARLKLTPAQCAMVGDTPHDAEACRRAGVVLLGVRSGGHNDATLLGSGARAVYADTQDLLNRLDEALGIASPGQHRLTQDAMDSLMRQALTTAREAMAGGEVPIGCVIARGDGHVIARGFNELNRSQTKTAHAEMVTFARTAGKVPTDARDLILVCTLEPCVMCTGAAMEASVDTILFGLPAPPDQGTTRVLPPTSPESQMPRIVGGILAQESRALFEEWLKQPRNPQQAAYVKQLLATT